MAARKRNREARATATLSSIRGKLPLLTLKRIRPASLYAGVPYAYATVAPPCALVFAAGACPLDKAGRIVAPGNLESQTRQTVRNLIATVKAAGSSPAQVLKTTIFVASAQRADLVRAWNVVRAAFAGLDPPSTLLGVSTLGYPDQLVEIEAIAMCTAPSKR